MTELRDRNPDAMDVEKAEAWRTRLGITSANKALKSSGLESAELAGGPEPSGERIKRAREEMRKIVIDRLGGDGALLAAVESIAVTSGEAVKLLEEAQKSPSVDQFSSLEAIVAFDGTRPSFLVRDGEIDLASSFCTGQWLTTLTPRREQLSTFAGCVGRIESGEIGIGTAFLVSPTLALTNRHVAQSIATAGPSGLSIKPNIFMDFGREDKARQSYDRRAVRRVIFAGTRLIAQPIDHMKLDLALLEVEPSKISSIKDRHLALAPSITSIDAGWTVAAVGYPGAWKDFVPVEFQNEHEEVIAKLLEGEKGSKRFAPGLSGGMLGEPTNTVNPRSATHDATTINGNSGSPLTVIDGAAPLQAIGLHYGGQWSGNRVNWAHVLAACAQVPVSGDADLRSALKQFDITL